MPKNAMTEQLGRVRARACALVLAAACVLAVLAACWSANSLSPAPLIAGDPFASIIQPESVTPVQRDGVDLAGSSIEEEATVRHAIERERSENSRSDVVAAQTSRFERGPPEIVDFEDHLDGRSVALDVRVVDPDGRPIEGADVRYDYRYRQGGRIERASDSWWMEGYTTDRHGRAAPVVEVPSALEQIEVSAGFRWLKSEVFAVSCTDPASIEIVMERPRQIDVTFEHSGFEDFAAQIEERLTVVWSIGDRAPFLQEVEETMTLYVRAGDTVEARVVLLEGPWRDDWKLPEDVREVGRFSIAPDDGLEFHQELAVWAIDLEPLLDVRPIELRFEGLTGWPRATSLEGVGGVRLTPRFGRDSHWRRMTEGWDGSFATPFALDLHVAADALLAAYGSLAAEPLPEGAGGGGGGRRPDPCVIGLAGEAVSIDVIAPGWCEAAREDEVGGRIERVYSREYRTFEVVARIAGDAPTQRPGWHRAHAIVGQFTDGAGGFVARVPWTADPQQHRFPQYVGVSFGYFPDLRYGGADKFSSGRALAYAGERLPGFGIQHSKAFEPDLEVLWLGGGEPVPLPLDRIETEWRDGVLHLSVPLELLEQHGSSLIQTALPLRGAATPHRTKDER